MCISITKKFVCYQKGFGRERIKNIFSNVSRGNTTLRCGKHFALELWVEQTRWKANARGLFIKGPYTIPPSPPLAQSRNHSDLHTGTETFRQFSHFNTCPSYKCLLPRGIIVTWEAHSANNNNPQHKHITAKPLTVSTPPAVVHDTLFAHYSCVFYTQEWLDVAGD